MDERTANSAQPGPTGAIAEVGFAQIKMNDLKKSEGAHIVM